MKPVLIFFGIALSLIALLFWAKMQPAKAQPLPFIASKISPPEGPSGAQRKALVA